MYLLDTNVASYAVNPSSPKHKAVRHFLDSSALFDSQIYICAITVSETEFGLRVMELRNPPPPDERLEEIRRRVASIVNRNPKILPITHHVARAHAALRAAYAAYKLPSIVKSGMKGIKGKAVELWHENVPPSALNISENDLWVAAAAINHDLYLVSFDQDHADLKTAWGPSLKIHEIR